MKPQSPTYLTQNYFGVFVFQYRLSNQLRLRHPQIQRVFRRSLYTREKQEALKKAKLWSIVMDELTQKLLNDPESYGRAIALLKRYQQIEDLSWERVESFLSELSDGEDAILELAIQSANSGSLQNPKPTETVPFGNSGIDVLQQILQAIQAQQNTVPVVIQQSINPPVSLVDDLPLTEIIDRFCEYKNRNVTVGTQVAIRSKLDIFIKILKEHNNQVITISQLDQAQVRHYRDTLLKIPAHRNTFPIHSTVKDWIRSGKKPISAKTAQDSVVLVGEMFDWISHEGYPIIKDLRSIFKTVKKPKADQKDTRVNFSELELKLMFESERYKSGNCKSGSDYWVPLIALFTGARMGEILQLYSGDIRQEGGVWLFDINDDDEKQVKTVSGKRLVPIHSQLIELGFLDYVKERSKQSERLFPEEVRGESGKFGPFSKRFNNWKNGIGIVKEDKTRKDFHSFRHTVRTKLTEASVSESLIDDIVGHRTVGASIGKTVYTHTQLIPQKKTAIETLHYDIDFSKIKPWDKHKLIQTIRNPELKRARL